MEERQPCNIILIKTNFIYLNDEYTRSPASTSNWTSDKKDMIVRSCDDNRREELERDERRDRQHPIRQPSHWQVGVQRLRQGPAAHNHGATAHIHGSRQ